MKVSRFGPKKRPDPSPEDEWLRQALLDAQDADLKTALQDAPPRAISIALPRTSSP